MAGLYIHIPFCAAKCAYCDFYSGPLREFEAESYIAAILKELKARRDEVGHEQFATIYVGGGTPSSINQKLLQPFMTEAAQGAEITIEANPEDVTPQWADAIMEIGVNRVSMGVQSLVDSELRAVGRRHTATRAIEAVATLRHAGVTNISLDLIYGLPGQTLDTWHRSLDGILSLEPQHLSAYLLSYEPGTRLYTRLTAGKIEEASDELVTAMYSNLCDSARRAGMEHYEISNFAMPGKHSRHNSSYWDFTPYLGLGPGAHSFDGKVRRYNPADLHRYMLSPESAAEAEPYEPHARHNDIVITALRTARGIDPAELNPAELEVALRTLDTTEEGRLRIAEDQWLLSNSLMEPLIRINSEKNS